MKLIEEIQEQLRLHAIQGWLLYDLHGSNELAISIFRLPRDTLMTRRSFYWIPQRGLPVKIIHKIEEHNLDHLPGEKMIYLGWREMHRYLQQLLNSCKRVAMEYSPYHSIPTISKVDGGLIDLIRSFGVEVVSSAPFLQLFTCVWKREHYLLHKEAAQVLDGTVHEAWKLIISSLRNGKTLNEYDLQQFILTQFAMKGCVTEGVPICGVNEHSADPHYIPQKVGSKTIEEGDLVLIDVWCKRDLPDGVFADITRLGVLSPKPRPKHEKIFNIVADAQRVGIDLVRERYQNRQEVKGCEVDQKVREVIVQAGYGPHFIHRTGHNIHTNTHGPGANLDSLETQDDRLLMPRTCFSVEPGIYLPREFGMRLENDLYIHEDGRVEVTLPLQKELMTLT